MQRKPNYDFERRERERIKAARVARKTEARRTQREPDRFGSGTADGPTLDRPIADD